MGNEPLVAVVTPFYNTGEFLAECIESVLAQTYPHWEYLLFDNCSTDGGTEIARRYAEADDRIRLIEASDFVDQLPNFNRALERIPPEARYVKMILADDLLMPRCLEEMVGLAERHPDVRIVSAYAKVGRTVYLDRLPLDQQVLDAETVFHWYAYEDVFLFGSPSTVLYRASEVRNRRPFFREHVRFADTDACFGILPGGSFGFVHQVLSFCRMPDGAITPEIKRFRPGGLSRYLMVLEHSARYLPENEAKALIRRKRAVYYDEIAEEAVRLPGRLFWQFHREALDDIGVGLSRPRLAFYVAIAAFRELMLGPYHLLRFLVRLPRQTSQTSDPRG